MTKRILIITILIVCLIVGVVAISKHHTTPAESEPTITQEESSTEDLNIQLNPTEELKGYIVGEDEKLYEKETVSIETQSFQEQMETLEAGDLIEKAKVNQESLEESKEESRVESNETQSQQEIADNEVLSDEEMVRIHEEFQSEIDDFNMREYERMMAEWKAQKGAE